MERKDSIALAKSQVHRASLSPNIIRQLNALNMDQMQPSEADLDRATELKDEYRLEIGSRKSNSFSIKDANAVLERIADGIVQNPTAGLVQALLNQGGDVCLKRRKGAGLFKMMKRKDREEVPSDLLEKATRNCPVEIIYVLVQTADDRALNQALPVAISKGYSDKASVLLAKGANAEPLCSEFLNAIHNSPDEMIELLLREARGACRDCRNKGLVQAATSGAMGKVKLLMRKHADVSYNNGEALLGASRHGFEDVAVEIASHEKASNEKSRPHYQILDMAVGEAYGRGHYKFMAACLKAGAKGPTTNETFATTVRNRETHLVDMFIQYGASVTHEGGNALRDAVRGGQRETVKMILQGRPAQPVLAEALLETAKLREVRRCHDMVAMLIAAGARGEAVSELLIQVLDNTLLPGDERSRLNLLHLLLAQGRADVNLHEGRCIAIAVAENRVQVLHMLINSGPSIQTLRMAIKPAINLAATEQRQAMVDMILKAGLVTSANGVAYDEKLLSLAVEAASERLLVNDVKFLAAFGPTTSMYTSAFAAAISGSQEWLTNSGLEVVQLLLEGGASGNAVHAAFSGASNMFHQDAVEMLLHCISPQALDAALMDVVAFSSAWQAPERLWLLQLVLECRGEWRCTGDAADVALVEAAKTHVKEHESEDAIDLLLCVGGKANVNFRQGEVLRVAIQAGDELLFKKLVASGTTSATLTQAFFRIITEPLEEKKVLSLLDLLFSRKNGSDGKCDVTALLPDGLSPLAGCIMAHRDSPNLVQRLLKLGCPLETEFQWTLDGQNGAGQEAVTVLTWALAVGEVDRRIPKVDPRIPGVLVDAKANVNFVSSVSKATPLIMAARYGISDVVRKLIQAKVRTTERDKFNKTALCYASREGHLDAVKQLTGVKHRVNDGSLHDAARNLHSEVVEVLIKAKHEPNFRSFEHKGRTALQELACACDGAASSSRIEDTVAALVNKETDLMAKDTDSGKNALFLALDHPRPLEIVKALLDKAMWAKINDPKNLLVETDPRNGVRYAYSADMYVKSPCFRGNRKHVQQLFGLLKMKGCDSHFYALSGPQPNGAYGVPQKLQDEDDKRRAAEEKRRAAEEKRRLAEVEHADKLRRQKEESDLALELLRRKNLETEEARNRARQQKER